MMRMALQSSPMRSLPLSLLFVFIESSAPQVDRLSVFRDVRNRKIRPKPPRTDSRRPGKQMRSTFEHHRFALVARQAQEIKPRALHGPSSAPHKGFATDSLKSRACTSGRSSSADFCAIARSPCPTRVIKFVLFMCAYPRPIAGVAPNTNMRRLPSGR